MDPIQVRFSNSGGKRYLRAEMHLAYSVPNDDRCRATFAWSDDQGMSHTAEHTFSISARSASQSWTVPTRQNVGMKWVEFTALP